MPRRKRNRFGLTATALLVAKLAHLAVDARRAGQGDRPARLLDELSREGLRALLSAGSEKAPRP